MFRRRVVVVRRPRILGAALLGGLGFAASRWSKRTPQQNQPAASPTADPSAATPDLTARLKELSDLHSSGQLSDEEFTAAKKQLLGS